MRKVSSGNQLVGSSGNPAVVSPANTARTSTDNVLLVQMLDAGGVVNSGSSATDDSAFAIATEKGTVMMGIVTADQVDDGDKGALSMNKARQLRVMSNPHSYMPATHWSPAHGQLTYLSVSSLTATGWPFAFDGSISIRSLGVTSNVNALTLYENGVDGISMYASANVLYILKDGVALSAFSSGDSYKVAVAASPQAIDYSMDVMKVINQSPDRGSYVQDSLVDTTNIAAGTGYFPSATGMSMDGFKDLSITGKLIEGDAVTDTLEVQVTNDEDTTNADWVSVYGLRVDTNTLSNLITTGGVAGTYLFAWDFDNLNYSYFRVKYVLADSTNTLIIKARRKSL